MCVLDDLDHRLIALLRSNSRTPVAVLARELGINRSTVTSRIDRLVDNGVIEGFTIRVSGDLEHDSVQGVMLVATENRRSPEIVQELRGYPELEQLHSPTGTWDLVLQIRARNLAEFDLVLERVRDSTPARGMQRKQAHEFAPFEPREFAEARGRGRREPDIDGERRCCSRLGLCLPAHSACNAVYTHWRALEVVGWEVAAEDVWAVEAEEEVREEGSDRGAAEEVWELLRV